MAILVTGGAGYIGSHTCVELLENGFEVIVVDNLCNSSEEALRRVEKITGRSLVFHRVDLLDRKALADVFKGAEIDAVIHFAALKAVGESVQKPLMYYHNNIGGALALIEVMQDAGVTDIVFSSSATVYGDPPRVPITEDFPLAPTSPYGYNKLMIEQILRDVQAAHREWNVSILRYFNPVGAHVSGLIGEDPRGIPNNLMPFISQVAVGKLPELQVFGDDYDTVDGTGVRDYIHVVDLARGHLSALDFLKTRPGVAVHNLGTGQGYSVFQLVEAFERASGVKIPYKVVNRRPGDIAICYADPGKAARELGWRAQKGLDEMCRDTWRWQSMNPGGFEGSQTGE
jgi:UDP-glucose 4-epimerase